MSIKTMLSTLLACISLSTSAAAGVAVDGNQVLQSIRGFGASSAWAGSYTTAQMDALFRVDTGIGLTLLRHRIPPDSNFSSGASILQGARDRGASIWAAAWSPPGQWKNNGSPNGPGTGACNQNNLAYLLPQNYQNYANYLASYVTTMRDTYNVNIFALSPQNEPNWCPSYEASWMTGEDFRTFVRDNLGPTFQAQGLSTGIIIPEPINSSALASLANPCLNDAACRNRIFAIGTHLYGAPASAFPAAAANGKEYWETEMSSFEAYDPSMTHGLTTADWIHSSMVAGMNAFHYWWAVSNQNNEGLISQNLGTPKRYYVMGNYSKFVRPGFNRIGATASPANNVFVSAYKNATQLVIVAVNRNTSASSQTFNLSGLSVGSATPWITDSSRNLASQGAFTVSNNSFTYSLPSQSVVSFVATLGGPVSTPTRTPTPIPTVVASTWRVNAGGAAFTDGAGNAWSADGNFTGGQVSSVSTAIAGTTDDALYQSERWGNSTYAFNVPAGSYQVTLKFAEIYSGITGAGQRVFNASINGSTVVSNLDLYGQVGPNTATDRVFNNVVPSGGQIVVNIGPSSVENAKVSAIQIIPQPAQATATRSPTPTASPTSSRTPTPSVSATPSRTATPSASPTPSRTSTLGAGSATASPTPIAQPGTAWRVNAGGAAFTDGAGNAWSADTGFTGGQTYSVTSAIAGTTDDALYQSERYGNSSYSFSVTPGSYQVTLKFAEIYSGITAAGQRVFNVSINGATVLSNLDVFGDVGAATATDRVFDNVLPSGGQIVVAIGPASIQNAKVSAIQIIPQPGAQPTATVTATPTPVILPGTVLRINAGGAAYTDGGGNAWSADSGFSGGTARSITNAVSGTTDDPLYQSERYGNSSYSLAVNPGSYQVTLKMAETYNGITAAGMRVFNASINGATVLSNLDLFADPAPSSRAIYRDSISPENGPNGGKSCPERTLDPNRSSRC